jgi:hypothetical protein
MSAIISTVIVSLSVISTLVASSKISRLTSSRSKLCCTRIQRRTCTSGRRTSSIVPIASAATTKLPINGIAFFLHLLELFFGGLLPLLGLLLFLFSPSFGSG